MAIRRLRSCSGTGVPNAPCGVESNTLKLRNTHRLEFLMHRVELKADQLRGLCPLIKEEFLMHRVELKALLFSTQSPSSSSRS